MKRSASLQKLFTCHVITSNRRLTSESEVKRFHDPRTEIQIYIYKDCRPIKSVFKSREKRFFPQLEIGRYKIMP